MSQEILLQPTTNSELIYDTSHCAYIYQNFYDSVQDLIENGVRSFSYYATENIKDLFNLKFKSKVAITLWCDIHAQNTFDFIKEIVENNHQQSNQIQTLGIYIPNFFFEIIANDDKWNILNEDTLCLKHGELYRQLYNESKSIVKTIDASKYLSFILYAAINCKLKILLYLRDATFAVSNVDGSAQQVWSATIDNGLIFPNHCGEVPMHVVQTMIQYVAYVNLTKSSNVADSCNEAYEILSKQLAQKQHKHSLTAAVGLVGYADTLKGGIVTPKDIERLAAPLIKNSFNVFPLIGSVVSATHGVSEGVWTSMNPVRFVDNKAVLSSDFVQFIKTTELRNLASVCNKDGYCFAEINDESRQQLIDYGTQFLMNKLAVHQKQCLATPLEVQIHVLQTIQQCFFTTVPMSLYISTYDVRQIHSNRILVDTLHKMILHNALRGCPVLLPEIKASEAMLNEARKRPLKSYKPKLLPLKCLKRKLDESELYDDFVTVGTQFLQGLRCGIQEIHSDNSISSFALKLIESIVGNDNSLF